MRIIIGIEDLIDDASEVFELDGEVLFSEESTLEMLHHLCDYLLYEWSRKNNLTITYDLNDAVDIVHSQYPNCAIDSAAAIIEKANKFLIKYIDIYDIEWVYSVQYLYNAIIISVDNIWNTDKTK